MSEYLDMPNPELWVGGGFALVGISIMILTIITLAMDAGHHSAFDLAGGLGFIIGLPFIVGICCIVYGLVVYGRVGFE